MPTQPKPKSKRAPKATGPKLTAPAPLMQACEPRATIASKGKAPPEIIWPAHVKVQHITPQPLPANAPIQASTMRTPYQSGQGLVGYQSL